MEVFSDLLKNNDLLSGGALLMLLGSALVYMKVFLPKLLNLLKNRFIFSIEIDSRQEMFNWFQTWLNKQESFQRKRSFILISDVINQEIEKHTEIPYRIDAYRKIRTFFVPSPGHYIIRYANRWMFLSFGREKQKTENGILMGFYETFKLYFISLYPAEGRAFVNRIIKEAYIANQCTTTGKIALYTPERYTDRWERRGLITPPPVSALVYKDDLPSILIAEIKCFLSSQESYHSRGVSWKLGYLLYGEPGNGKTTLVKCLAGLLKMDLYIIDFSSINDTDTAIGLFSRVPAGSIVLIEDIDCTLSIKRDQISSEKRGDGISFSTVLNLLDGVYTKEGQLTFMTTNFREKLDRALIRPGRIDREVYISNATPNQARGLFNIFYDNPDSELAMKFSQKLNGAQISMSSLQSHFMRYQDAEAAVENAYTLHTDGQ